MLLVLLLFTLLTLVPIVVYYASQRKYKYWEKKNVPHLKPVPILGNFSEYILLKKFIGHLAQKLCQAFPDAPYVGAYYGTEPALIVQDPSLIKLVMTKDYYYFSGREVSKYTQRELITQNLFFTYGDRWKVLRQNLTPIFSSAKMKNMFHLIEKCSRIFENILDKEIKLNSSVEVRSLMARFTMDCIGSAAFGVDTNTMEETENNPFKTIGEAIFETKNLRGFKNIARAIWPAIFYGFGFQMFPKQVDSFFFKLMSGIFKSRNYTPTARNDFVDLILKIRNKKTLSGDSMANMKSATGKKIDIEVDDAILMSQCVAFFAAGFETSATTLSFTLYELAKSPEAQERAIAEVDAYLSRHDNKIKYECVTELPYVEACFDEALRLYPVLSVITREVTEDYTFPTGLKLEKGLRVHIPVYHLHCNPDYFPEPEKYRPERFYGEEKRNVKQYTYMPFGEGPRICIGMRFARMQMMAGLITILKKYKVELADDMTREVEFTPSAIVTQPLGGIRLKFLEREGWQYRVLKPATS